MHVRAPTAKRGGGEKERVRVGAQGQGITGSIVGLSLTCVGNGAYWIYMDRQVHTKNTLIGRDTNLQELEGPAVAGMIFNLFLKQGLYFINSGEVRLRHELPKLLQTLRGD